MCSSDLPGQLLFLEPLYFIQLPDRVVMLWQRNSFVRNVRLNGTHPAKVTPSWFGDSIGHYENGDTLVIDTVGLAAKPFSYLDAVRTPHSEKLHVVERWRLIEGGKTLEVNATVEDPDTFEKPWSTFQRYRRGQQTLEEDEIGRAHV